MNSQNIGAAGAQQGGNKNKWDPNGKYAKHILRGFLAGTPGYATWDAFRVTHAAWIKEESPETGFIARDNLRRNYHKTINRWQNHVAHGNGKQHFNA